MNQKKDNIMKYAAFEWGGGTETLQLVSKRLFMYCIYVE